MYFVNSTFGMFVMPRTVIVSQVTDNFWGMTFASTLTGDAYT